MHLAIELCAKYHVRHYGYSYKQKDKASEATAYLGGGNICIGLEVWEKFLNLLNRRVF